MLNQHKHWGWWIFLPTITPEEPNFFAYDVYNDGSIYVSQEDDFGQIWKKNLDEVIDELCSVRDEINRLKNEYDNDEFLKFMDKNFEYDVPIHDYQTQRKDSIGE